MVSIITSPGSSELRCMWLMSFCAFLVSVGINFTRIPIIYAFRLMSCEEYYKHNLPYTGDGDRCSIPQIEASTAQAVSVLGITITINGVINLIFANWSLKSFGIKSVLIQQLVGPTIRLGIQRLGVRVGAAAGIRIVQVSQLLGVVGGSTGYVLILNTFVSQVVIASEQTMAFGTLQGAIMLGTAVAYLSGGVVSDAFGIGAAFEVACFIMVVSIAYSLIALPSLPPIISSQDDASSGTLTKLVAPVRVLLSLKTAHSTEKSYSRPLLLLGVFNGVLATGFIPVLLQMFATNTLHFGPRENGYVMALTFGVRSLFLTIGFPVIIRAGHSWIKQQKQQTHAPSQEVEDSCPPDEPNETSHLLGDESKQLSSAESRFDLWFLTMSFFADAALTAATAFSTEWWHLYLAAVVLPLASGSAPAAKGVIISICEVWEQPDALGGLAMVEMMATVLTMTIFGFIFSALATLQKSYLVSSLMAALHYLLLLLSAVFGYQTIVGCNIEFVKY